MPWRGWPYPFLAQPWEDIAAFLDGIAAVEPTFRHMADIPRSIVTTNSTDLLAGCTSMHDLIVVSTPIPEPPFDVIAVRSPSSLRPPPSGQVLIEHLAASGRNDRIIRPTSETLPLFWRFVSEKFGVRPAGEPTA